MDGVIFFLNFFSCGLWSASRPPIWKGSVFCYDISEFSVLRVFFRLRPQQNSNKSLSGQWGMVWCCTNLHRYRNIPLELSNASYESFNLCPCTAVQCGSLPDPPNGRVFLTGTVFRSTASYQCNPNYILIGVPQRTCQANGAWSEEEPECQRRSTQNTKEWS